MSQVKGNSRLRQYLGRAAESVAAISHLPGRGYGLLTTKQHSKSTKFGIQDLVTLKWIDMSQVKGNSRLRQYLGRAAESVAAISHLPGRGYGLLTTKQHSKSTKFGIRDLVTLKWIDMSQVEGSSRLRQYLGRAAESLAAISHLPGKRYGLLTTKQLSKSTKFGIWDLVTRKWLLRFDHPHKGVKYAHVNINAKLTGVRDPHLRVPDWLVNVLGGAGTVLRAVDKTVTVIGVAFDAYRLGYDATQDMRTTGRPGKRTGKTAASIGGGWGGGLGGAAVGNATGGWIGGTLGVLFGGAGAVVGTAIGSLMGTAVVGVVGGVGGSVATEAMVDKLVRDVNEEAGAICTVVGAAVVGVVGNVGSSVVAVWRKRPW